MMQKVQRWSQPCWISTKARLRSAKPEMRCAAVSLISMMSETAMRSLALPSAMRWKLLASSFSELPSTWSTSGRLANFSGAICAAQPVTMILASGFSRLALRIAWRAWRSASAVTAQVLTMIASESPAAAAWPRITSLSKVFRRQPMVMRRASAIRNSLAHRDFAEFDLALEAGGPAPGHHDVIVRQPFDGQRAAVEHHLGLAAGKAAPRRGNQR